MPAYSQWMFVIAFGIIPIPLVCLTLAALGYLDRPIAAFWRWYDRKTAEQRKKQAYDPKTGIGRGAPGFQTNVRRIAVPRNQVIQTPEGLKILDSPVSPEAKSENEWIPAGHGQSSAKAGAKKAKKRK